MIKNILLLAPSAPDSCAFYRGAGIIGELRKDNIGLQKPTNRVSWIDLANCDIAYMQRPYSEVDVELAQLVKYQVPLIIDYDDLLFDIPPCNISYPLYMKEEIHSNMKKIMSLADIITVSTYDLAENLKEFINDKSKFRIIPNAYNDYRLPTNFVYTSDKSDKKVVLWRGTHTHVRDLLAFAEPINQLVKEHPNVRFVFYGFIPWMIDLSATNIELITETNIYSYFHNLKIINADLMIVPLEDNLFNRCKSPIAWIETARYGTNVVAPNWKSWNYPGIHHYENEDSFYKTVKEVLSLPKSNESWLYIQQEFFLSKINKLRTNIIEDLLHQKENKELK